MRRASFKVEQERYVRMKRGIERKQQATEKHSKYVPGPRNRGAHEPHGSRTQERESPSMVKEKKRKTAGSLDATGPRAAL